MLFTDSEWSEYLSFLSSKEGYIEETVQYLSNKMDLLEKATLHLTELFAIYPIVILTYKDRFLNGQSKTDKINFLKKFFETLFIYSKNLLTRFSFYFDKAVKEEVFQDVKYLSQFTNNPNYISLIGYAFHPDTNDCRFTENTLTPERATNLLCLTMCCSVGYDYWPNLLKYLNLTVFTSHRLSIEKLITENKCDYCDFDLNPNQYLCTVCNSNIDKMSFFDKWHRDLTKSLSLQNLHDHITPKPPYRSLDSSTNRKAVDSVTCEHNINRTCDRCAAASLTNKNNLKPNTHSKNDENKIDGNWTCECTYKNQSSNLNCQVCFKENINRSKIKKNEPISERNLNKICESVVADQSYKKEVVMPRQIGDDEWACPKCTAWNSNKSWFCEVCLTENRNSENNFPIYTPTELRDIDTRTYFEQSQRLDESVRIKMEEKDKGEKNMYKDFVFVDLSMKQNMDCNGKNVKETSYLLNKNKKKPESLFDKLCNNILTCALFCKLFSEVKSSS